MGLVDKLDEFEEEEEEEVLDEIAEELELEEELEDDDEESKDESLLRRVKSSHDFSSMASKFQKQTAPSEKKNMSFRLDGDCTGSNDGGEVSVAKRGGAMRKCTASWVLCSGNWTTLARCFKTAQSA